MAEVGFEPVQMRQHFWGCFGSAVDRDDIHCNARQCRCISTGLNTMSAMNKRVNYITKPYLLCHIIDVIFEDLL